MVSIVLYHLAMLKEDSASKESSQAVESNCFQEQSREAMAGPKDADETDEAQVPFHNRYEPLKEANLR